MAVSAPFKQACPSCDFLVPVKDPRLIGKKVQCPNCKFPFVIEKPKSAKQATGEEEPKDTSQAIQDKSLKTAVKRAPAKPAARKATTAKDGQAAAGATDDSAPVPKKAATPMMQGLLASKKLLIGAGLAVVGLIVLVVAFFLIMGGGSKAPPKQIVQRPPNRDAGATTSGKPARDKGIPNKDRVGKDKTGKDKATKDKSGKDKGADPADKDKKETKDPGIKDKGPDDPPLHEGTPVDAELTNLLPNDPEAKEPEHVVHYFFRDMFSPALREIGRKVFADGYFQKNLGFSLLDIDDLIRAERYTKPAWTFTVVHTRIPVEPAVLQKALGLESAGAPIKRQNYYRVTKRQAWLEQFGRVNLGAAERLRRALPPPGGKPLLVRFHDSQTLIFADEAPMKAFLQAEGRFPLQTERSSNADAGPGGRGGDEQFVAFAQVQPPFGKDKGVPPFGKDKGVPPFGKDKGPPVKDKGPPFGKDKGVPPFGKDKKPPDKDKPKALPGAKNSYLTIDPRLKAMLDTVETRYDDKERILVSMATDLEKARIAAGKAAPGQSAGRFRQLWDITQLIQDREIRAQMLGLGLSQTGERILRFRNEVQCPGEADARDLYATLFDEGAPEVARFIEAILSDPPRHVFQVQLPSSDQEPAPPPPSKLKDKKAKNPPDKNPPKSKEEPAVSRIRLDRETTHVSFSLELALTADAQGRLRTALGTLAQGIRGEADLMRQLSGRHDLGKAGRLLAEQGLKTPKLKLAAGEKTPYFPQVPAGRFPPGALPRGGAWILNREPSQRISWMAGLLPYLGREKLYDRINFAASWRDPSNWLAGRTLVPEFIDPAYPDATRYAAWPDMPFALAATHLVGIAGIGLDAGDYSSDDPAVVNRRGVFGYERSATLKEIQAARGLSNTIFLMQVPHDGVAGVTPWIAGGGATVRGVPDKNSIAPFVLSNDRDGKPITRNGKRGAYAIMTDSAVRWFSADTSDEVFKALCTVHAPAPAGFDPDSDDWAELVPAPDAPPKHKKDKQDRSR